MRDSTYIYIEKVLGELLESCKERRLSYEDQMYLLDFIYTKNSAVTSSRSSYGSLGNNRSLMDTTSEISFLSTFMSFLEDRSNVL